MLATGSEFIKHGMMSVETAIGKLLDDDAEEIHMLVYSFGDPDLLEPLKLLAGQGKKIVIVVSNVENIKENHEQVYEILEEINREKQVTISDFKDFWHCYKCDSRLHGADEKDKHIRETGHKMKDYPTGYLHAKTIVKNRNEMIVGSSNFTKGGLQNYYELGVYIKGIECSDMAEMIDSIAHDDKLTEILPK